MISGNMVGSYSQMGKTLILVDENGNEVMGVVVDQETVFTAGDNDVREGFVYASDGGVSTGTKFIPSYHTVSGQTLVLPNESFSVYLPEMKLYDYTSLQCIICAFNNTIDDSVGADKIVLNHAVYPVNSTVKLSDVTKDSDLKSINLNVTNNTDNTYLIYYFTYREEV